MSTKRQHAHVHLVAYHTDVVIAGSQDIQNWRITENTARKSSLMTCIRIAYRFSPPQPTHCADIN